MEKFYITVTDIHLVMSDKSRETARKNFGDCKKYCVEKGIKLFDTHSIPTKEFCKFMNINYKLFVEVLQEKKEKANGKN